MKKLMLPALLVGLLFVTGCNGGKGQVEKYEKVMEEHGKHYYEKYQKGISGLSGFDVTIAMLENANKQGENYDLKKLEKCKDDSGVKFTVEEKTGNITKTEFNMNCGK